MLTLLGGIIVSGNFAGLLLFFVGLVLALAIIFFILKQLESPQIAYRILYVVIALIALLLVIDFFFGSGVVIVR